MGGSKRKPRKFFVRDATPTTDPKWAGSDGDDPNQIEFISLASGEEYLWRPVLAGLCSYRDVNESRVDLCDIAIMNELLDVQTINNRIRAEDEEKRQRREQQMNQPWR